MKPSYRCAMGVNVCTRDEVIPFIQHSYFYCFFFFSFSRILNNTFSKWHTFGRWMALVSRITFKLLQIWEEKKKVRIQKCKRWKNGKLNRKNKIYVGNDRAESLSLYGIQEVINSVLVHLAHERIYSKCRIFNTLFNTYALDTRRWRINLNVRAATGAYIGSVIFMLFMPFIRIINK